MSRGAAPRPYEITELFVYGTLRPGDVRWHLLEPYVSGAGTADQVDGALFDTGLDFPAAMFSQEGTIHGLVYELRPDQLVAALDHLDRVEGTVAGLYRRVAVTTRSGRRAWAYEYGSGLDLTPIASGDWMRR